MRKPVVIVLQTESKEKREERPRLKSHHTNPGVQQKGSEMKLFQNHLQRTSERHLITQIAMKDRNFPFIILRDDSQVLIELQKLLQESSPFLFVVE